MEKYEKISVVGRGAYGTVYLCRRVGNKKPVIIKQIPVEQMTTEERQAALNESKVLSMLHHPNIIEYYENFLEDKALMIVMEYAEGGTLFEYLQQKNDQLLEEEEILKIFAQLLLSLQHVHSKQILHRDLKTQNILMNKRQEVIKIGDFGISKVLSSKSKAHSVVGTPCYISPELCEGKPYNQKSDIWALGCVLYELASLKRAFEAPNLPALILKIMRGTFAPIAEQYSCELGQLILSMLHLDPNKRPSINEIMAQPIVINALLGLYTDFGKLPCRRVQRPLLNPGRGRRSRGGSFTSKGAMSGEPSSPVLQRSSQPVPSSCVYSWGGGVVTPTPLPLPSSDIHITQVSAGRTQRAAVTSNGRLILWQPGMSVATETCLPGAPETGQPVSVPRFLEGQSAVTIKHVSCGDLFTACLTDRGILMTFGSGANGCLGHNNYNDISQAKIVEALLGFEVVQISCGASHIMAVTSEHEVFAWGKGDSGRLGLGDQSSCCCPMPVDVGSEYSAVSALCGLDCSILITTNKQLLCCGSNRYNKLALDDGSHHSEEVHKFTPIKSFPLSQKSVAMVSMGSCHSVAVTECGECYTFGSNQFGQLGCGVSAGEQGPVQVEGLDSSVTHVACGDTFTVAVTQDGTVYSWGKSSRGRLGRADTVTRLPQPVTFTDEYCHKMTVTSLSCSHGVTLLSKKPISSRTSLISAKDT